MLKTDEQIRNLIKKRGIQFPVYHLTSLAGYEGILRDQAIVPLGLRASDETIASACNDDIQNHYTWAIREKPILPSVIKTVMETFLQTRPAYSNRREVSSKQIHTPCLELALGYGQGVLLSQFLEEIRMFGPYYFVFDGSDLVTKGMVAISNTFENVFLDTLLQSPTEFFNEQGLVERIKELANRVHLETETQDFENSHWCFFPNILPVEWAIDHGERKDFSSLHFL